MIFLERRKKFCFIIINKNLYWISNKKETLQFLVGLRTAASASRECVCSGTQRHEIDFWMLDVKCLHARQFAQRTDNEIIK